MTPHDVMHMMFSMRARKAGLKIGKGVKLSLGGTYSIRKTAIVILQDGVWLAQSHHIEAHPNARISIGSNVHFGMNTRITAGPGAKITIKDGCFFNHDISIIALDEITVGENSIGSGLM